MRRKDISLEFTNINSKLIEEAAEYRSSGKKLVRVLALAACIAVLVTAIPLALILNRENGNTDAPIITTPSNNDNSDPNNDDNKSFQNVIYCEADLTENDNLIKNAFHNQEVVIKNSKQFEGYSLIYIGGREKLDSHENVPKTLNFSVGGIDISATLDSLYYAGYSEDLTNEVLKNNSKIAKYLIDTINGQKNDVHYGKEEVYYSITNEEIIGITTLSVPSYAGTEMTEEAILEIAKKDVVNLYGDEFLSQHRYVVDSLYRENDNHPERSGWNYTITFTREFGGFVSNEYVKLYYNGEGQLSHMRSSNINSFDNVQSKLTKEVLDEVDRIALEILDGRFIYSKVLKMSTDGDVYIFYQYYEKENTEGESSSRYGNFYIKVGI